MCPAYVGAVRQRVVGALLGVLVLVPAACSGDDEQDGSAPDTLAETSASVVTTDPPTTTTVAPTTSTSTTIETDDDLVVDHDDGRPDDDVAADDDPRDHDGARDHGAARTAGGRRGAGRRAAQPGVHRADRAGRLAQPDRRPAGNPAITIDALAAENGIADANVINAGVSLDICVGNGIDDITGAPLVPPTTVPPPPTAPVPTTPPPVAGLASACRPSSRSSTSCSARTGCGRSRSTAPRAA